MTAKDGVVARKGQWLVRVVLPGKTRATILSRHANPLDARIALAFWREDMYGEIEECVHRQPWHRCACASRDLPRPTRTHVGGYAAEAQ